MVGAAVINFTIGFGLLILVLYRAGDIQAAIDSPTGQPYIAILLNCTGSVAGTAVLVVYMIFALVFCATNLVTTSSRQLFSFARDRGVPFSAWLSQVSQRNHVPLHAVICTIMITVVLSLILMGSSLAFNVINSLFGVALLGSYLISVATLVYQRLHGSKFPRTRFSLGRFGLLHQSGDHNFRFVCLHHGLGSFYISLPFAFTNCLQIFFPAGPNPTAKTMNWACLIFGSVVTFAAAFYRTRAKKTYRSPVEITRVEENIDLSPVRE